MSELRCLQNALKKISLNTIVADKARTESNQVLSFTAHRFSCTISTMHVHICIKKTCIHSHTCKTKLLSDKYFCEQDVGKDKHSSWLLNRSARQCVVHGMCVQLSLLCLHVHVQKWPRWELEVVNKSLLCVCWSACVRSFRLFCLRVLFLLAVIWRSPGLILVSETQV